jgi:hypothetical protein
MLQAGFLLGLLFKEAIYFYEMSVDINGLQGVIFYETDLFR